MTPAQRRLEREWYIARITEYQDRYSVGREPGSAVCGARRDPAHRCFGDLEVDHVPGARKATPADLQSLCRGANSEKGSRRGPKLDYRSDRFKAFMAEVTARDWTRNELTGRWKKRRGA